MRSTTGQIKWIYKNELIIYQWNRPKLIFAEYAQKKTNETGKNKFTLNEPIKTTNETGKNKFTQNLPKKSTKKTGQIELIYTKRTYL